MQYVDSPVILITTQTHIFLFQSKYLLKFRSSLFHSKTDDNQIEALDLKELKYAQDFNKKIWDVFCEYKYLSYHNINTNL